MPFSLNSDATIQEVTDAVNYLLSNFGSNVVVDTVTGVVAGPTGAFAYYYKYIAVKYADSYDGSVGFSDSPTNKGYYGIRNTNSNVESTNPEDYIWTKVTGGFGTTNFLWYITYGGRQIAFQISPTAPSVYYVQDPGTAIDLDAITATTTLQTAITSIYQWTSSSTPPTRPTTTTTYTWATNSYTAPSGWSTLVPGGSTPGQYLWTIAIPLSVNANVLTSTLDWTNTTYPIVSLAYNGVTGPTGGTGSTGPTGPSGTPATLNATVNLYQWANSTPGNPSGTTTYTWATGANSSYTGGNGWLTYIPTNPATPNTYLWEASIAITAPAGTATTTVNWSSGYAIASISQNGAQGTPGTNGQQSGTAIVYQWASTIPTITGSSTYIWADGSVTSVPTGWYATISDSPSAGYTLFSATVTITDSVTATTTSFNWSSASVVPFGYAGSTGATAVTAYTATSLTLNSTPNTITTTGSGSLPPTGSWGTGVTWSYGTPTLSTGQNLWQTTGIYNPSSGNIIWGVPYRSVFKVGNLSALSTNTGNLTVTGTFQSNTAAVSGSTLTGSGAVIYSSGIFGIGNSSNNIVFNGSNLNINGGSNINITGTGVFNGSSTIPTYGTSAIVANNNYSVDYGINAFTQSTFISSGGLRAWNTQSGGGNAIYANHTGSGNAVLGQSANGIGINGTGVNGVQGTGSNGVVGYGTTGNSGVLGQNTGTGYGVYSNGIMGTNNSGLVTSLYAQYAQTLVGTAGVNQLRFTQGTLTGGGVASFVSTNKPGSSTSNTWIQVQIDSTTFYIPVWT